MNPDILAVEKIMNEPEPDGEHEDRLRRIAKKYSQQIAAKNCHHTNISEMITLEGMIRSAMDEGAGHWMDGYAEMAKERDRLLDRISELESRKTQ